jgi:predicted DNA-binding transcriptional regulator AlpA
VVARRGNGEEPPTGRENLRTVRARDRYPSVVVRRCAWDKFPYPSLGPWATQVTPGTLGIGVSAQSINVKSSSALIGALLDRVLDAHELGEIYLRRSAETIFKDITRAPHRLPPSIRIRGRRGRVWLESEVLRWLRSHQQTEVALPGIETPRRREPISAQSSKNTVSQRQVGRPTKRQQRERAEQSRQLAARGGK